VSNERGMMAAGQMRRILVAYDGSPAARRALDLGAELATATGAEVGLVSAVPDRLGPPPDDPWSERSEHAAELHEAGRLLAAAGIAATLHEPSGPAGPAIVQVATDLGYDTVVIGSRRLDPVRRTLLGSVSTYVVRHAPMTVIVAR
jgi:nucleotide-binding universal stress UspA family protein